MLRFPAFSALALTLLSMSPAAALSTQAPPDPIEPPGSRFVACDNGLRCVRAPCPSRSAVNLDTRRMTRGVDFDLSALTEEERADLGREALYYASKVLEARIEPRPRPPEGPMAGPSLAQVLVVTAVFGPSTPDEAAQCRGGGDKFRLSPTPL